jgi:hypothetical protein
LARPNYSHSKRQRELVKKQKREEKLAKKLEKKTTGPDDVENMQPLDGPVPPEGADGAEPES